MRIVDAASPQALKDAVAVLRAGEVVIHPTETCYGIACDLRNPAAVKHLFDVKRRPADQPVSALFSSIDAAREYVDISPKAEAIIKKHLPGPLTVVLPRKKNAPSLWLTASGDGKDPWIGVRISSHPVAQKLVSAFGGPIATTSANLHGEDNPYSPGDIETQWKGGSLLPAPDHVLNVETLPVALPSTVVRVDENNIVVLRQGALHI